MGQRLRQHADGGIPESQLHQRYDLVRRVAWETAVEGNHMPASITKSAPASFAVTVSPLLRDPLHRFLSGTRARLADELLQAAADRPEYMQPALLRDKDSALRFFAAGPQLVRTHRLRHGIRTRVIDVATYRGLVVAEIAPVVT